MTLNNRVSKICVCLLFSVSLLGWQASVALLFCYIAGGILLLPIFVVPLIANGRLREASEWMLAQLASEFNYSIFIYVSLAIVAAFTLAVLASR